MGHEETILFTILGILCGFLCLMFLVQVWVCWILYDAWNKVPQQCREGEPFHAWLLLVPICNLVMPFFVHPRISRSYRAYFAAYQVYDVGDCGEKKGTTFAILMACSVVPYLGLLAMLGALAVEIVYVLEIMKLRKRLMQPQMPQG
jgi:hypothetical protein